MSGVPYIFANATTSIPLSELDSNFATPVTIGNTTVALGNTVTILNGLANVGANVVGSTANVSFTIQSNSTSAITVDTNQNMGLGVTPSAWSGVTALQLPAGALMTYSTNECDLIQNAYYNGTNWIYKSTNPASDYQQYGGAHNWKIAASGTAGGTIAWTQAMTLDASGDLLVGQTTLSDTTVGINLRPNGYMTATMSASTNATDTYHVYSTGAGAYRFYVDMGGTVHATSTVITAISDERLKENVRDLDTGISTVMALKPRRYDWKEGKGLDKKNAAGFIAQEFETVFPDSVGTSKAGADGIEYKNINYEELIPTLVKAIQEQQAIITDLQTKLKSAGVAGF